MNFWEARQAALVGKKVKRLFREDAFMEYDSNNFLTKCMEPCEVNGHWEIVEEPKTTSWFCYVDNIDFIGPYEYPSESKLGKDGKGNWIEIITDENGKLISAKNV